MVVAPPEPGLTAEAIRDAAWARVQHARDVRRPHTLELLELMCTDVVELHGDRLYRDDPAIVAGFATLGQRRFVFVGQQKGSETDENIRRNFGMPHPEGYRKAMRLFALAERLGLPVVTFVDTPGAFPGSASEERGVAEAIARSIAQLTRLRVPVVVVITGEGGSGGALALAAGDVVLALENAIYSVISPEGCASILWRTAEAAQEAAVAMRLTAGEQLELGVVDEVVPEPEDGAQADPEATASQLAEAVARELDRLVTVPVDVLLDMRYARYRAMGAFVVASPPVSAPRVERTGLTDRLRSFFDVGRIMLGGPEAPPLRPQAADDVDEPPLREEV
ncbi:MAG TPA: acetyl-CoA carboxylase carboxyltransferase subunit alpha [Candidatus Limnocylindrales bacterium]|jgi:acetyl-CoA carboxylase carboxyl transferase alpha subunit